MKPSNILVLLGFHFCLLSLVAFGGANGLIPEIHRLMVHQFQWMTEQQFMDYFALSRGAPGPNVLIATLMGWHVSHFWGALTTTLAISIPSSILTYGVSRLWQRSAHAPALKILKTGLVPVILGFVAAAAYILCQVPHRSTLSFVMIGISAVVSYKNWLHPFWIFMAAIVAGIVGWI